MNWKTVLGALLLLGSISELSSVIGDYRSGELEFWPVGVGVGALLFTVLGIFLIKKGMNSKKDL